MYQLLAERIKVKSGLIQKLKESLTYLTGAEGAISKSELYDLGELGELHLIQDDQGSVHTRHRLVG